ncbi:MAG: nucleotidyltransferase domain-containing protein [Candidatus Omnitrophota bacterium]
MKNTGLSKENITNFLKENKIRFKKYGVVKIGLFGSYVNEKNKKRSDVDILVEFNKGTFDNYLGLRGDLEKKLHAKVDLVSIKALKNRMKSYILKEVKWV